MYLPISFFYVLAGFVGLVRAEFDGVAVSLLQVDLALRPMTKAKVLEIHEPVCEPFSMYAPDLVGGGVWLEDNSILLDTACKPLQRPIATRDKLKSFCLCRQTQPSPDISRLIVKHDCPAEPTITSAFSRLDAMNTSLNYDFIAKHSGPLLDGKDAALGYDGIYRFDIWDNQVDISGWNSASWGNKTIDSTLVFPKMLLDVAQEVRLPNMSFVLSWADGSQEWNSRKLPYLEDYDVPTLGVWRTEGRPGVDILSMPRSLSDWGGDVRAVLNKIPNASYTPTSFAVFRGGMPNASYAPPSFQWRYEIQQLARRRPDLIDAGTSYLTDEQQMRYQVILVPDGYSLPDRLARQMAYGKPVVFIHPQEFVSEFWYPEVQPWVHYVPSTGPDLELTLDMLRNETHLIQQIGANGKKFAEERFSERRNRCYMYRLLEEYAARFKN